MRGAPIDERHPLAGRCLGDTIEMDALAGRDVCCVERTWIVDPEGLFHRTCPQRFIVRAVREDDAGVVAAVW